MISRCNKPKKPQRNPKPRAWEVSGSKVNDESFKRSFSTLARALRSDDTGRFDYKWNYDLTSDPDATRLALEGPREVEPPELEQMKGEGTPVRRRRG